MRFEEEFYFVFDFVYGVVLWIWFELHSLEFMEKEGVCGLIFVPRREIR